MRVLLWGTYDTGKPRARILTRGMREVGITVEEIHANVWEGVEDKSQVKGLRSRLRLLARWAFAYPALIWRLARADKPDVLLVGYPGILDALIATCVGHMRRIPVAWDVFISLYDTMIEDRKLLRSGSVPARLLRRLERMALHRVDIVFMDTQAHARRIEMLFDLPPGSSGAIWVGTEAERFKSVGTPSPRAADAPMKVLFYGQFIPLHGISTIIEAARELRDEPVEWTLIGRGQEAPATRGLLQADPLPKVQWIEWVDYDQLRSWIAQADLCLGIFGTSEKAASVIPNKVFQMVAAGRPLITRDSPAIRELLQPSPGHVYLVPGGDPEALADAVRQHLEAGRWRSGIACHRESLDLIGYQAIGTQFLDFMQPSLAHGGRPKND